ncbi:MAG: hypothetical protein JJT82_08740 [Legionellaceae bacterium]|nr:hypothetical protein [Legionellaceae bacterium]
MNPAETKIKRSHNPLNLRFFGLDAIPKAEVNLVLGCLLGTGMAVVSASPSSALGVFALSFVNYMFYEKPEQNELLANYYRNVGASGLRNGGGSPYDNPEVQSIIKGLTHPFFRTSPDQPQTNVEVITNAARLR